MFIKGDFFETLPTERLLGEGVLPEHINDDVLGRTLDEIYEYGCTELFNKLVLKAMKNVPFGAHIFHTDTTNFSLHGKYENLDPELNTIEITYGHPKDMRWDILGLYGKKMRKILCLRKYLRKVRTSKKSKIYRWTHMTKETEKTFKHFYISSLIYSIIF